MNRIDEKFARLRKEGGKAFIPFITCGDPDPSMSEKIVLTLERAGADIVELGVPFSDPIADGSTIQASSQRALNNKVNLRRVLQVVRSIRRRSEIPLALLTYFNPIYQMGIRQFVREAKKAGVDGVIIPDLPLEETGRLKNFMDEEGLDLILLVAPTSVDERIKMVGQLSGGFIYVVSVTGTTGAREKVPYPVRKLILQIKKYTNKPICLGFGISTPEQVKVIRTWVDGIIVGSALIKVIEKNLKNKHLLEEVEEFAVKMKASLI